jgi:hypothetical protein
MKRNLTPVKLFGIDWLATQLLSLPQTPSPLLDNGNNLSSLFDADVLLYRAIALANERDERVRLAACRLLQQLVVKTGHHIIISTRRLSLLFETAFIR